MRVIPDEAVEAAAEALVGSTLGDRAGIKWEEFFEAARSALEAAAPHLMSEQQAKLDALSAWAGRSKVGYYDEAQDDVVRILFARARE
jgi:hypothetical protein